MSVPYEERVVARIGNLGWNEKGDIIAQRAQQVLHEAGIQLTDFRSLTAVSVNAGSSAELIFHAPAALTAARLAVKALNKSFVDNKFVWLDAKKERRELRPSRLVHRIADVLDDLEHSRPDTQPVEKILNGKFVKVAGQRAGFSYHGAWKWTHFATQRYTAEQLDMARAYAEDE